MSWSRSWQNKERLVAGWFSTCRNPLSGRNNVNDAGERRCGDIIYGDGVIEVKRKKNLAIGDALETRDLAASRGLPFAHFEFKTGQADIVTVTLNYGDAKTAVEALRIKWGKKCIGA